MYSGGIADFVLEPGFDFYDGIFEYGELRVGIRGWSGWLVGAIIAWLYIRDHRNGCLLPHVILFITTGK